MSKNEYKYGVCPLCNTNIDDKQYDICDNDCGTVYCDCGNEYHIINDKCLLNHNPKCGGDEYDDEDFYEYDNWLGPEGLDGPNFEQKI